MTSQRLVEDFARWLWNFDWNARGDFDAVPSDSERVPDGYMNHAAIFLAGELGQRLQYGDPECASCGDLRRVRDGHNARYHAAGAS